MTFGRRPELTCSFPGLLHEDYVSHYTYRDVQYERYPPQRRTSWCQHVHIQAAGPSMAVCFFLAHQSGRGQFKPKPKPAVSSKPGA